MPGKEQLDNKIKTYLNRREATSSGFAATPSGGEWISVNSISLAAISMIVLIRKRLVHHLSEIKNDVISVGLANTLANKGGACISFKLAGRRLLFINCHLEAHQENRARRNEQWRLIHQKFVQKINTSGFSCLAEDQAKQPRRRTSKANLIPSLWDAVIWLGDFNSRTQGFDLGAADPGEAACKQKIFENLRAGDYGTLRDQDQLYQDKAMFIDHGFQEGDFHLFAPTFKLKKGTDTYGTKRNPSWTDRIIYKNSDPKTLTLVNYDAITY